MSYALVAHFALNLFILITLVEKLGYMTSKGELIRAILFPKPIHFRFYTDLLKVAGLFCVIGLAGMAYSIYVWIRNGVTFYITR